MGFEQNIPSLKKSLKKKKKKKKDFSWWILKTEIQRLLAHSEEFSFSLNIKSLVSLQQLLLELMGALWIFNGIVCDIIIVMF